jgi:sulfotransferase 6B1
MNRNIFVNTIPHSGTHLVTALLDQLDYKHTQLFNRFYSKRPFYRRWQKAGINWRTSTEIGNYFRYFSDNEIPVSVASPRMAKTGVVINLLSKVKGGEYIIGHVPYSKEGSKVIEQYIAKTITIIRDPRDMALSMLNHISARPAHMAHNYLFGVLLTDSERLEAVVNGYKNQYGSLAGLSNMYRSMLLWKKECNNITLKFEDLVGAKGGGRNDVQFNAIKTIIEHIELPNEITDENIVNIGLESFGKSSTFRKGKIGRWRSAFNVEDKKVCKQSINDLLIELNYESSNEW